MADSIQTYDSGDGRVVTVTWFTDDFQPVSPDEATLCKFVFSDGEQAFFHVNSDEARAAAGARETAIHRAADANTKAIETSVKLAFARGRAAVNKEALRSATSVAAVKKAMAPAVDAVRVALKKTLEPQLLKAFVAGGRATVKELRTAGGKGSGNFGHGGRPGEVGGSSDSDSVIVYHGTPAQHVESIRKNGILTQHAGRVYQKLSKKGHVYVATNLGSAKYWATLAAQKEREKDPVANKSIASAVVEVHIPREYLERLGVDKNFDPKNPAHGDNAVTARQFKGDIRPEWIKNIHVSDNPSQGTPWRQLEDALVLFIPLLFPTNKLRTAGDVDGHPFHGNQYTDGQGSSLPKEIQEHLASAPVYHGTSGKALAAIKSNGLVPNAGKGADAALHFKNDRVASVYVTHSLHDAKVYASYADKSGLTPVILKIQVPANNVHLFKSDESHFGSLRTESHIPAEWIIGVSDATTGHDIEWRELTEVGKTIYAIVLLAKDELRSAKRTIKARPKTAPLQMSFDIRTQRSIDWAKEHATELIDDLADTTKKAITDAIVRGFESGKVGSAYNDILDALFEDEVLGAVGDESRAEMIARTEAMRAANGGQREAWNQAVDSGLLDEDTQRVWIFTDVGACDVCEGLDGKTAPLGGEYDGGFEGPPAHPRCRCTEGLSFDVPRSAGGKGSGNFGHVGRPGEIGGSGDSGGSDRQSFLKAFDPTKKETWYRTGSGWHRDPEGESAYPPRSDNKDYEPPDITHKVIRGEGVAEWGRSHYGSTVITGEAAHQMGIDGWKKHEATDTATGVATRMLQEIADDSTGSEEPLYHSFENKRGTVFQPGDTMQLPLIATAGQPETAYATRMEHESQEGAPTVFAFPTGTPMVAYGKWPTSPKDRNYEDGNAKEFGHVYTEAIVAGKFRVTKVETVYMGSQHSRKPILKEGDTPQLYGQVVHLEPLETFNPKTGKWVARG